MILFKRHPTLFDSLTEYGASELGLTELTVDVAIKKAARARNTCVTYGGISTMEIACCTVKKAD